MSYQINELCYTLSLIVGEAAYFRIEIFKANKEPNRCFYFSEAYLLRWPNGMTIMKGMESDTTFRQHWHYLDDFPAVRSESFEEVKARVTQSTQEYGLHYSHYLPPRQSFSGKQERVAEVWHGSPRLPPLLSQSPSL